jgi:hypothetical protein
MFEYDTLLDLDGLNCFIEEISDKESIVWCKRGFLGW